MIRKLFVPALVAVAVALMAWTACVYAGLSMPFVSAYATDGPSAEDASGLLVAPPTIDVNATDLDNCSTAACPDCPDCPYCPPCPACYGGGVAVKKKISSAVTADCCEQKSDCVVTKKGSE
jgi:hypothetical protein